MLIFKILFISSVVVFGFQSLAAEKMPVVKKSENTKVEKARVSAPASSFHFLLAYGSEYRPERDVEKNFKQHYFSNYAIGIGKDQVTVILEKAEFKESSGNTTLNLERTYQNYLLWGQYAVLKSGIFNAFAAGSLGMYKESVTTQFLGSSTTNNSKDKFLCSGALGVRMNVSVLFASLEARMFFGDELDPQPAFGALLRAGLWF